MCIRDSSKAPRPEYLAEEIYAGEMWLKDGGEAPTTAFNHTQEYSYYHKLSTDDTTGQIDSIEYWVEDDGARRRETDYAETDTTESWTDPIPVPLADSPDNFPGGRLGQTPPGSCPHRVRGPLPVPVHQPAGVHRQGRPA